MSSRIEWVGRNCRLLAGIRAEFETRRPLAGLTIGTGIHLEPKTVALLLTLAAGGARVVATGNLNSTQPDAVEHLRAHGVEVIGGPTTDADEHDRNLRAVLAARPQLILDNGGDLFARYLEEPYDGLLGGTEETTSGRARLEPLRAALGRPVLVINDSPIKQFAENEHAVGQSVVESFLRITNRITNGTRVTVLGYGACGRGVAACFRNAFATVAVVDIDPVTSLRANLDGFAVPARDVALGGADVVVTVTGAPDVVTEKDLDLLKDGAILLNAGHFPTEIAVARIRQDARVTGVEEVVDGVSTLRLVDGRQVHLLTGGHMVNLAGPRPLGNSIESMDLGFALQARCLEAVARGDVAPQSVVVPVPVAIDRQVAQAYLALHEPTAA
ncbi:adenosylhomocysteinase [Spongisporangium articulatum]|uniref:Adenosylhomocysteinase n=1 Tax=Spongisporangium articulatum TaxID=3362603 RepID=A0ABW8APT7_9ACTN